MTVTQGRRRLVPAASISAYVELGHASTNVIEKVYRKELRPVLTRGATAMDALFGGRRAGRSTSVQLTEAYDSGSWAFCRRRS